MFLLHPAWEIIIKTFFTQTAPGKNPEAVLCKIFLIPTMQIHQLLQLLQIKSS